MWGQGIQSFSDDLKYCVHIYRTEWHETRIEYDCVHTLWV